MSRSAAIVSRLRDVQARLAQLESHADTIGAAADLMVACLKREGKVLFCGNGGSAADSQHLAAELMGRYLRDRKPLPALALTVDTSALTAIGNDYGYEHVFSRQLRGVGRAGDVLFGLSTSGNSANVVQAFVAAKEMGIQTIALTGESGGKLAAMADVAIKVPSSETNVIQEMHIVVGHTLCGYVEEEVC
ncbi:MAG TPA: D-sedoheptulose 7-phosphate isomerase [Rhizomicrobium sp.]|nr:D-sedoheptulose 7-phosphate isomerase [Rhizomicrobium sp.]